MSTRPELRITFLLESSKNTLQSLELTRQNHAANLTKEMFELFDRLVEETVAARMARFFRENRDELLRGYILHKE